MSATIVRALPRVRVKRPKPRPPRWWAQLRWFAFEASWAVMAYVVGVPLTAAGMALGCGATWRTLARWPEDSLTGPRTDSTDLALRVAAFALCVAGVLT